MINMIWIIDNSMTICSVIVAIPLFITILTTIVYTIFDMLSNYEWFKPIYSSIMDDLAPDELNDITSWVLITEGIANIVIPCLAIAGYLYLNNITLMEFYNSVR